MAASATLFDPELPPKASATSAVLGSSSGLLAVTREEGEERRLRLEQAEVGGCEFLQCERS